MGDWVKYPHFTKRSEFLVYRYFEIVFESFVSRLGTRLLFLVMVVNFM